MKTNTSHQYYSPRLAKIAFYPIKSCAPIRVASWDIASTGLTYDRRWMLVDEEGKFLSQRRVPLMATLTTHLGDDHIRVERSKGSSCTIPLQQPLPGKRVDVRLHGSTRLACETSTSANTWFSETLNTTCRLVESVPHEDPWRNEEPEANSANTYFPDLYPILITNEKSLEDLFPHGNIPMDRFRPNLVVKDANAFAEDEWESIEIGNTQLKLVKPCARCQVTTVDQTTGVQSGTEPLKTLRERRRWHGKAVFGWNVLVQTSGRIQINDSINIRTTHAKSVFIGPK